MISDSGENGISLFDNEFSITSDKTEEQPAQQQQEAKLVERDLDSYPAPLKEEALKRFRLLAFIRRELQGGWTPKNLNPLIQQYFERTGHAEPPSSRTVCNWWKSYEVAGGKITALVPKHHRKGNYELKNADDGAIFHDALERFLNARRPSMTTAYEYYKDQVLLNNEGVVEGTIKPLSYSGFKKRIKQLPPYQVAVARHGKFMADQWYGHFSAHKPPTRILEKVEIDHTPLDLILIDDELLVPLGRPYLTLLVDVFSSCIVGFHLGYRAPSYDSVSKAIIHATKPKDYLDTIASDFQNDWPCSGKIETLVVDNGAEFWSESLEQACLESGINIQFNPVRKPWLKPFIERLFGTINKKFLDPFPGKTFSNVLEKEEYNPEKDAVIRFSTFIELFHRWIIDVYHQDSDSRHSRIPAKLWQQGYDDFPPLAMTQEDIDKLTVVMGVKWQPTLTRLGFKIKHLRYDSPDLSEYRKRYPQTDRSRKKLVKIDPDDISRIFVYLEELEGYLEVPCEDPIGYTKNLSWHHHQVISHAHHKFIEGSVDILSLAKARQAIHQRVLQDQEAFQLIPSKKKRMKGQRKLAEFSGVGSEGKASVALPNPEKADASQKEKDQTLFDNWDDMISDLDGY
ncbi:DDE-type integrase/transposase/recombinase [Enterovibrio sp. ZSDZ42]|uniref:DDE-type integrase/transposase/recombinase n=1 Tax=Enterovibrio gelatinilyticus TaxID=2899819 RepID=A0ABT5R245_9GAMM|nr:Mu transposase C-terminal domain-containing protein [Enterovibrio sp. ZSDZ42]MDD1794341.1 DDE-type integrase/transposase/recombinase [Enterovibrio sp. ZSDZ42]